MKLKIGDLVKIKDIDDEPIDFRGLIGKVIAIGKEKNKKEYIIQFKKPVIWSYFIRKEFIYPVIRRRK